MQYFLRAKAHTELAKSSVPEPAEILAPYFLNNSCDPFGSESKPCTLENYVSYSVDVRGVDDIIATVRFANKHNIRLVIKNTGHDFLGKSTGKGGLAIWTHHLNSVEVLRDYSKFYYKGPAMRLGAGAMGGDAALAASQNGYRVVAGTCSTVGIAGGFAQGGGHSLLSGIYGLGADNVLEWEVVTSDGKHVVATPNENADLYWALSGGGGGTFGVVVSMTTRVFEDGPVGRASLGFSTASTGGDENFWAAVDVFHNHLQPLVDDHGIVLTYTLGKDSLMVYVITAPNRTSDEVSLLLSPLLADLSQFGLSDQTLGFTAADAATYYEHFMSTLGPVLSNVPSNQLTSGRIISRDNMANNRTGVGRALRGVTSSGHFSFLCTAVNLENTSVQPVTDNSVQEHWRDGLVSCVVAGVWDWTIPWDQMAARQHELTNIIDPLLTSATPGSGTYLNEANFQQSDWQSVFYGGKYAKLKAIKKVWDPLDLFYGPTAVGSESWSADSAGRLCRTGN
ncbi:hypothetical protein SGCOL_002988 [Colletotrichum sp. CLE4]